jgi:LacI family transcriptional regulator
MQRCIKCDTVDGVIKAGFVRGKQRYFCKSCEQHFVVQSDSKPSRKRQTQTTISDVAKHLGVSISTVSKALNGKSDINQATKEAILKAAHELDYKPNLLAQSLHAGKTSTIGVVVPDIGHPYFAKILSGMQKVAMDSGYRVITCQSNESYDLEIINTETLLSSRVDGLLISHSKNTTQFNHIKQLLDKGIPVVNFDRVCQEYNTPKVLQQDYIGSIKLTEHLIEQGYTKIAMLLGPESLYISQTRLEGYKVALKRHELTINSNYIIYTTLTKNDAVQAFENLMSLPEPPDAILSINHRDAIYMMNEAQKRGIAIPEQLGFAAHGDDVLAELYEPSLTVYDHFPNNIGEAAITMLIENINNRDTFIPYAKTLEGELIIRRSSVRRTSSAL